MPISGMFSHLHVCVYALVLFECKNGSIAGLETSI